MIEDLTIGGIPAIKYPECIETGDFEIYNSIYKKMLYVITTPGECLLGIRAVGPGKGYETIKLHQSDNIYKSTYIPLFNQFIDTFKFLK